MRLLDILSEAPIGDWVTIGDFSKNSSFRHETDRMLVTNPKSIEKVKQKFANNSALWNLYFVNSAKANKHTEIGLVKLPWVEQNLGKEVADAISDDAEGITIIFTNNKGAERLPFTGWIMAHRIAHVLGRYDWGQQPHNQAFKDAHNELLETTARILADAYGIPNLPYRESKMNQDRRAQLLFREFFHAIGTFRSARNGQLRDWFEMINELFAQYLTTGTIKFNPIPKTFGKRGAFGRPSSQGSFKGTEFDFGYYNEYLDYLASSLQEHFDEAIRHAKGRIWVM